jgi:hypothetical protein
VAYPEEGEWFNPINNRFEVISGVRCHCYECSYVPGISLSGDNPDGIFFSKSEYRQHKWERLQSYNKYKIRKQADTLRAHTKETEALAGHGRPASVTTRFNLHTGQLSSDDDRLLGNVRWETLWRAYLQ